MKLKSFKKGIHPYEGKELSKDSPIQIVNASATMVYPLSQHIGAPAKAVVAKGDKVLKGQLIAEADGLISSPVYSSVSGTVKAIEKRIVANGSKVDCIVVENDNNDEVAEGFGVSRNLEDLTDMDIAYI
ncbi:MAG: electron transporter RnfC, partial [Eubacterium sp.]|nr:electron transporter RnfC [Eubacterium sp.]